MNDQQMIFSEAQDLFTPAAGTIISTNKYDQRAAQELGRGNPLFFFVIIKQAFAGGTSLEVQFRSATANDGTTGAVIHWRSGVIATAAIPGTNSWFARVPLPAFFASGAMQRWLCAAYVTVGDFTAGTITSGMTTAAADYIAYPSGLNFA